jgi:hypothetical protein
VRRAPTPAEADAVGRALTERFLDPTRWGVQAPPEGRWDESTRSILITSYLGHALEPPWVLRLSDRTALGLPWRRRRWWQRDLQDLDRVTLEIGRIVNEEFAVDDRLAVVVV